MELDYSKLIEEAENLIHDDRFPFAAFSTVVVCEGEIEGRRFQLQLRMTQEPSHLIEQEKN